MSTRATANLSPLPASRPRPVALWPPALALAAGSAVLAWALAHGRVLLYGDATAHLAIARRIVDSATPGLSQLGTVWLPLPHLLFAALVRVPGWWRTGVAGSLVSILALAAATAFLHRTVWHAAGAVAAAWAAVVFCLNPSLLYLSAVPMTESIYLAAFLGLVYYSLRGRPLTAGAWGLAASLCRYDGWFALPFAALCLLLSAGPGWSPRWSRLWRFSAVAAWGPLFWFAFNQWYFHDWLAFARGPYSARQIYLRALRAGGARYPGDHQLGLAALYFFKTVALTCGGPLLVLALLGLFIARRRPATTHGGRRVCQSAKPQARPAKFGTAGRPPEIYAARGRDLTRTTRPTGGARGGAAIGHAPASPKLWILLVPCAWYIWAMWSGNVPIFVPQYWPHGYYNLRYGVQALPAVAAFSGLCVGALVHAARRLILPRAAFGVAAGLTTLAAIAYLGMLRPPGPIAYQEAVHNAPDRLATEAGLSQALRSYRSGDGVLMYFGTYPGALANDGIPLHQVIQESNFLLWLDALHNPQQYVEWIVRESNGPVDKLVNRQALARYYHSVAVIAQPGQPRIEVYHRND